MNVPLDLAARCSSSRVRRDGGDGERRRGVAERGQRLVADVQHPLAEVARAGDGEVPRELQVVALDAAASASAANVASIVGAPVLDRSSSRWRAGRGRRRNAALGSIGGAGGVDQAAQADDEGVALGQRDRPGGSRAAGRRRRSACASSSAHSGTRSPVVDVDEHDRWRRRRATRSRSVHGGSAEASASRSGDVREDRRVRAEAVVAVPLGRVDRDAVGVGRHARRPASRPADRCRWPRRRRCRRCSGTAAGSCRVSSGSQPSGAAVDAARPRISAAWLAAAVGGGTVVVLGGTVVAVLGGAWSPVRLPMAAARRRSPYAAIVVAARGADLIAVDAPATIVRRSADRRLVTVVRRVGRSRVHSDRDVVDRRDTGVADRPVTERLRPRLPSGNLRPWPTSRSLNEDQLQLQKWVARLRRGRHPSRRPRVGRARGVPVPDRPGGRQDRPLRLGVPAERVQRPDRPDAAGRGRGAVLGRRRHRHGDHGFGPRRRRHQRQRHARAGHGVGARSATARPTTSSSARSASASPTPAATSRRCAPVPSTTRPTTSGCSTAPRRGSPTVASPTCTWSSPRSTPS